MSTRDAESLIRDSGAGHAAGADVSVRWGARGRRAGAAALLVTLGVAGAAGNAETRVHGEIGVSTTWTAAGSPYVLDGHVRVRGAAGPVLTIEPGVTVRVGTEWALVVGDGGAGELRAVGTAEKPIVFTTAGTLKPGRGDGLKLGAQSGQSRLEHAVVEGAGRHEGAGVIVVGSRPVLRDVTVRGNASAGIDVSGGGAPEIARCEVSGTTGGDGAGLRVTGESEPSVREVTIRDGTGSGVLVEEGGTPELTDVVIRGNGRAAIEVRAGTALRGLTGLVFTGNGQDGVRHRGGELSASETWRSFGYPYYVVDGHVRVRGAAGPVLTIEPGVTVRMGTEWALVVGDGGAGELRAVGTAEKPIVFTTAGTLKPGAWDGLKLGPQSGQSRLEHAVVEGAGRHEGAGVIVVGSRPVLRDVTVRGNASAGIDVSGGGAPEIARCEVSGTTGGDGAGLRLAAGTSGRIESTRVTGCSGAGLLNRGSFARIRFLTISSNRGDGVKSTSGELTLRDGSVTGQLVPVRNTDTGSRVVDARQQWWGAEEGARGLVGRVETEPWLGSPSTPEFAVTGLEVSSRAFAPGRGRVRFDASLPSSSSWVLRLHGADGREVRRFEGTGREAVVAWDGTAADGTSLPDGGLLYRFEATEQAAGRTAAPLLGTLQLDSRLPTAFLSSPAGVVRAAVGSDLEVEGSAAGPGFESYVLEQGPGDFPSAWTVVDRGSLPVSAGRLGTWTTALLPSGRYTLRLTVTGPAGTTAVAKARVELVDEGACR